MGYMFNETNMKPIPICFIRTILKQMYQNDKLRSKEIKSMTEEEIRYAVMYSPYNYRQRKSARKNILNYNVIEE